jgi:predicted PurR-regulated permease PerM
VVAGSLPALLLEAGLGTAGGTIVLFVAMVLLQVAHQQVLRRLVTPRTLVVGPAVIVISVVLGYEVYGVGGAAYTAALAVFAVSALDVGGALQGKGRHAVTPT